MALDKKHRIETIANDMIENNLTTRSASVKWGVSKSLIHRDIHLRLDHETALYKEICAHLNSNFDTKYIRGGEATRRKWHG